MNKLDFAAVSGAGGALVIAGVSMTSGEAKGWLDVLDEALNRPGAVALLLALAIICLIWLMLRGAKRERECDAKFGRLEQIVLHLMRGHPDEPAIVNSWDKIKTGEMSLDQILSAELPERRPAPRRSPPERRRGAQRGFLLTEAIVGVMIITIAIAGALSIVLLIGRERRAMEAEREKALPVITCLRALREGMPAPADCPKQAMSP
jgi:hypothetical protein